MGAPDARAARRAELLHVLMLPDFERADRIGVTGKSLSAGGREGLW
jgi:hypothetical protein